jgi:peroxiredoxin
MTTTTSHSTGLLATALAEQQTAIASKAPTGVLDVLERSIAAIAEVGITAAAVAVGDQAPTFVLPDATGNPVSLHELLADGPVVVSFYRGGWCPYCNLELRALQAALPEITAAGARLVAISPQTPDESLSTQEKADLTFDVLSDADADVSRRYGLVYTLDDDTRHVYAAFGNDLARINGTDTWELPVPATYVIGRDGTVTYAFVDPDYRHRAEPADVVAAVNALA